ncbi:MAG: class I tRNA ligase family protein, partial [Chloroflexota bacterium]|nr:class I tRNA ligase family protein [Chloroflexota bacterium]
MATLRKAPVPYDHLAVEQKWQRRWEADGLYRTPDDDPRPKWYALTMFPYPSGDLHIGHWFMYSAPDAYARYMRMRGYNVLFPMGFDAFGLPAENAAIRNQTPPGEWTYANIERMRRQFRSMGTVIDWEREIVTCDPSYYRWNQWLFLKLYEAG